MKNPVCTVSRLCDRVKLSRQGYYRHQSDRKKKALLEELILTVVKNIRSQHPMMGCRKLHHKLQEHEIPIGRDKLFGLLKRHDLLIRRRKRYVRTTDSRHGLQTYNNLLKDMELTGPNQAWVSDITYIKTLRGFLYLSLISDAFSRKIVGYHLDDCLWSKGNEKALNMALRELPTGLSPIHHSDRGKQYCSELYVKKLKKRGMAVSMTEENHCYENAMAERLNGILKDEYLLKEIFQTRKAAQKACREAVKLYNVDRPHMKLGMLTPQAVHMSKNIKCAPNCDPNGSQVKRKEICQLLIRT